MNSLSALQKQAQTLGEHLYRLLQPWGGRRKGREHVKPIHGFPALPAAYAMSFNTFESKASSVLLPNIFQGGTFVVPKLQYPTTGVCLWSYLATEPLSSNTTVASKAPLVPGPVDDARRQLQSHRNHHASYYFEREPPPVENKKLSAFGNLVHQHGSLVWNTYWGIYFGTLSGLFAGFESGVLDPMRLYHGSKNQTTSSVAARFMRKHRPFASWANAVEHNLVAANFILAWLVAEALEPLRIGATVVLVPTLAKLPGQTTEEQAEESPQEPKKKKERRKPLLIPC